MAEGVDGYIAVELAIDPFEQIEVESGGDAFGVIVGGEQPLDRFYPVHPDQQLRARAEQGAELAEQVGRAPRDEIADGRTGEKAKLVKLVDAAGQAERAGEIGDDRDYVDRRKILLERGRAGIKIITRNVDRNVGRGRDRLEQDRGLGCRAGAEFNHRRAFGYPRRDLGHDRLEDADFGSRRIISRQPRDFVEQFGAAMVVEPARGHCPDRGRKTLEDIVAKRASLIFKRREQGEAP